ncbi:MAG TPA: hypothetical protein VN829_10770 [Dongiaceae bacterium]|nr:hypothetical protein [Dongiaceae bacterium]
MTVQSLYERYRGQCRRWALGCWSGCLQGGALSVKAFFGTAGLSALGLPLQPMDWRQGLAVFASGALWHAVDYLAKNPFPVEAEPPPPEQPHTP